MNLTGGSHDPQRPSFEPKSDPREGNRASQGVAEVEARCILVQEHEMTDLEHRIDTGSLEVDWRDGIGKPDDFKWTCEYGGNHLADKECDCDPHGTGDQMTASDHLKHRTGSLGGDQEGEIEVIDRADGAAGSWCIRKIIPGNTAWYWNKGKWTAFAQVFKHDKETADWIAKAEAALAQKTRECEEKDAALKNAVTAHVIAANDRESLEAQVEQLERQVAEMEARIETLIGTTCNRCERGDALFVEPDTGFYTHTLGGNYCDAHRLHSVLNTKAGVEARARTK